MVPSTEYFADFFKYVRWADRAQLAAAQALDDTAYFKDHGWSFGTVHKVMLHMVAAQDIWLQRFEGRPMHWLFEDPAMSARVAIEPAWTRVHEQFTAFLGQVTPAQLEAPVTIKRPNGETRTAPMWRLLTHALNHSTIHRGQLNSMIKLLGGKPPQVDYTTWTFAEVVKS